jgi:hypothetical protein
MRNALIFHGTIICVVSVLVVALKGKQNRRERDEIEARRAEDPNSVELSSLDKVEEIKEA